MKTNTISSELSSRLFQYQWVKNLNPCYLSGKTKAILAIALPLLFAVVYHFRKNLCPSRVTPRPTQIILPIQTVHARIQTLITEIEQEIQTEGIYRESGETIGFSSRLSALNANPNAVINISNVSHKASFVKALLRALKPRLLEPLHPFFSSGNFNAVSNMQEYLAHHIPADQLNLLSMVILHLGNVARNSATNKMDSKNFGSMVGPNFFADELLSSDPRLVAQEFEKLNAGITYLIDHP